MNFPVNTNTLLAVFFAGTICMGASCCKKDEPLEPEQPTLPPETQTGEDTFGCLIDGKVWLPKGGGLLQTIERDYYYGSIIIGANKRGTNGANERININVTGIFSDTLFIIDNKNSQNFYYRQENPMYYPDSNHIGEFHLKKLDTINNIMSGTFWFDAIDTTTEKIVQIRDGRFDLKY